MANMNPLTHIAVFTGSALGNQSAFKRSAVTLGQAIANIDATLVYGGSTVGLMGMIADATLAAGGRAIGVLPKVLMQLEIAHQQLDELIVVDSMAERKDVIIARSDAFIALPGGIGTLDELFEVYTLARLEYHNKPIGLLNVNGYYDKLLQFLDEMTQCDFLDSITRNVLCADSDPQKLFDKMRRVQPISGLNQKRFGHLHLTAVDDNEA